MIGRLLGLPRPGARAWARELLARFDLTDAGPRPAKTYSGGMRRRLDLAASVCSALPGLPGRSSGQISPASTTCPASRASKVSRTRNWRPPTWTGRPVSSRT